MCSTVDSVKGTTLPHPLRGRWWQGSDQDGKMVAAHFMTGWIVISGEKSSCKMLGRPQCCTSNSPGYIGN